MFKKRKGHLAGESSRAKMTVRGVTDEQAADCIAGGKESC